MKSTESIFNEVEHLNPTRTLDEGQKLREDFERVKQFLNRNQLLIGNHDLETIKHWTTQQPNKRSKHEKIAVIWKAMELTTGHVIRDVQILSLLTLYRPGAGKILQIDTGEGKTIIIAMLAVLFGLDGRKVDIVTTSSELSVPQSKMLKIFYSIFNLSSTNIDKVEEKDYYKFDVLYGSVDQFQADVLRDEFLRMDTRASRPYDIVIVDEADSMLVDGISHMVRLSSPMPGMANVLPILIDVWTEMNKMDEKYSGVKKDASEIITELMIQQIMKLTKAIQDGENFLIPEFLMDFVIKNRLQVWVKNAYRAKHSCTLGKDYIIRDNDIKIVDLYNTGIVFDNMRWTDGLHQFLQLKHDVYLTSEELVTNFLGNPTFFYKYSKNIYGLSGTLGCDYTKNFLASSYDVESIVIPPFKVKQHETFDPIVTKTRQDWFTTIVDNCLVLAQAFRAVMIIAESINETNEMKKLLEKRGASDILMYQTDKDSKVVQRKIKPGQIIIATNICGRGVNIVLTDEANDKGGLHICLTFLPENDRVQRQNIGRTSRAGNPGSSQIIVFNQTFKCFSEIVDARDKANEEKLMKSSLEMKKIKVKSLVFEKFCKLLNSLERKNSSPDDWNYSGMFTDDFQEDFIRELLKEEFSIWLKNNEDVSDNNYQELLSNYEKFETSMKSKFINQTSLTKNSYFYINSGIQYIQQAKYDTALKQLTRAIEINEKLAAFAFLNRAVAQTALKDIHAAVEDLKVANSKIAEIIEQQIKLRNGVSKDSPGLTAKFDRKIELMTMTELSIVGAVETLLSNQREGKHSDILFINWTETFSGNDLYLKDGAELMQCGWVGPIEVKERKVSLMKKVLNNIFGKRSSPKL